MDLSFVLAFRIGGLSNLEGILNTLKYWIEFKKGVVTVTPFSDGANGQFSECVFTVYILWKFHP